MAAQEDQVVETTTEVVLGRSGEVLDRDLFCRTLIGELAQTLQDVVGLAESSGFVAVVGQVIGRELDVGYRSSLGRDRLDQHDVAHVLTDLKRRIGGSFRVESTHADHIVLVNDDCPFGDRVHGRPSLCMMTSNVFGAITAENLGYSKVRIDESIATGDAGCRVVVWTRPTPDAVASSGREYFAAPASVADPDGPSGAAPEGR